MLQLVFAVLRLHPPIDVEKMMRQQSLPSSLRSAAIFALKHLAFGGCQIGLQNHYYDTKKAKKKMLRCTAAAAALLY